MGKGTRNIAKQLGRMRLGLILLVFFVALALVGGQAGAQAGLALAGGATLIGVLGGLVAALVNIFKKQPSPIAVIADTGDPSSQRLHERLGRDPRSRGRAPPPGAQAASCARSRAFWRPCARR